MTERGSGMRLLSKATKLIACYLVAGAIYLLYFRWSDYQGHAHIPFARLPGILSVLTARPGVPVGRLFGEFVARTAGRASVRRRSRSLPVVRLS